MSKDRNNKTTASSPAPNRKLRLIENEDFTWAGWPDEYPVPLFTWEELNEILVENNNKIPENMWKERIKRKK